MRNEGFYIFDLDLSTARSNQRFQIKGKALKVLASNPNAEISIKFDTLESASFPMRLIQGIRFDFDSFYLTNDATAGNIKILVFDNAKDSDSIDFKTLYSAPEPFRYVVENSDIINTWTPEAGYQYDIDFISFTVVSSAVIATRTHALRIAYDSDSEFDIPFYYGWTQTASQTRCTIWGKMLPVSSSGNGYVALKSLPMYKFDNNNKLYLHNLSADTADTIRLVIAGNRTR